MLQFKYHTSKESGIGKIKVISPIDPIEADIDADGWNFHVIVGSYINGNYICIPNWNVGSDLADLSDTFWNSERLMNYTQLGETNSLIVSQALATLNSSL